MCAPVYMRLGKSSVTGVLVKAKKCLKSENYLFIYSINSCAFIKPVILNGSSVTRILGHIIVWSFEITFILIYL